MLALNLQQPVISAGYATVHSFLQRYTSEDSGRSYLVRLHRHSDSPTAARAAGGLTVPHADVKDGKRFSSPDTAMEENRLAPGGSEEKRAFTYFVLVSGGSPS